MKQRHQSHYPWERFLSFWMGCVDVNGSVHAVLMLALILLCTLCRKKFHRRRPPNQDHAVITDVGSEKTAVREIRRPCKRHDGHMVLIIASSETILIYGKLLSLSFDQNQKSANSVFVHQR